MTFADKTTLGQSAVLGILPGAHLTQNQFNWLGTIFYLSYLAFEVGGIPLTRTSSADPPFLSSSHKTVPCSTSPSASG